MPRRAPSRRGRRGLLCGGHGPMRSRPARRTRSCSCPPALDPRRHRDHPLLDRPWDVRVDRGRRPPARRDPPRRAGAGPWRPGRGAASSARTGRARRRRASGEGAPGFGGTVAGFAPGRRPGVPAFASPSATAFWPALRAVEPGGAGGAAGRPPRPWWATLSCPKYSWRSSGTSCALTAGPSRSGPRPRAARRGRRSAGCTRSPSTPGPRGWRRASARTRGSRRAP